MTDFRPSFALLFAAVFLLGACSGGGGPTIRIFPGGQGSSSSTGTSTVAPATATPQAGGVHTVRRGDTLYAIARSYGVPLRTLIVENALAPPYTLEVGQRIRIPAVRTHTVRSGDTVLGIARQYGVSANALVRANGIAPPYTIRIGQKLSIPAPSGSGQVAVLSPTEPPPTPASPGPSVSDRSAPQVQLPRPAATPRPPVEEPEFGPDQVIYPSAKPAPPPRVVGPIPQPPARAGGFLWPVQGRIVSGFGPKPAGLHNDGINIAAPRGSAVRAAEAGVVAYAGDGLKGFGNTVLIKHSGGYVTAYAHTDALLVSRGDVIVRGQAIARVGSTGSVDSPQLHFQIRKGREPIDPRRFLPTG